MTALVVKIRFLFAKSQIEAKPKPFKDWVFLVTFHSKRLDSSPSKDVICLAQIISLYAEISSAVVCLVQNVSLNNLNNPFYIKV